MEQDYQRDRADVILFQLMWPTLSTWGKKAWSLLLLLNDVLFNEQVMYKKM